MTPGFVAVPFAGSDQPIWTLPHEVTLAGQFLLELVDRRQRTGSLLITSQYPTEKWHAFLPDPTVADAVLDRIVHKAHRITLKGESMRKVMAKKMFATSILVARTVQLVCLELSLPWS
ncbi:hypothetical protein J2X20_000483 [Pelomonas saccharophila]|uniref:IstB-like ATP-binding domain-containing protein n=1 Tax=Roseateles saccharophilus TaxID=304 RepID=A0ABU1YG76_ROSSA|nr:hypothetical protein [Roseateles saccharophilus]